MKYTLLILAALSLNAAADVITKENYIALYDTNNDNKLSPSELLKDFDKDNSGTLDAEEKKAAKQDFMLKVYDLDNDKTVTAAEKQLVQLQEKQRRREAKLMSANELKEKKAQRAIELAKLRKAYLENKAAADERSKTITGDKVAGVKKKGPKKAAGC